MGDKCEIYCVFPWGCKCRICEAEKGMKAAVRELLGLTVQFSPTHVSANIPNHIWEALAEGIRYEAQVSSLRPR